MPAISEPLRGASRACVSVIGLAVIALASVSASDQWPQFSRPSGVYIDKNDAIYVADSESESVSKNHDGWKRGIRVGKASDGSVAAFIPDPAEKATGTSAAEGVAADAMGNIFGAEVGPKRLMKYTRN